MDKYEKSFAELVLLIEKAHKKKKETIQEQEKREVGKAKKILDRLQKEITVLKKKHAEFTELSQTDDHIHFLQIFPLLTVPAEDDTLTNKITIADFSSEEVKRELSCVKEYLEELYQAELNNGISKGEALALMTMFEEPKSREDFLKYTHQLTLDPNTANNHIWLSEDNTKGTYRQKTQLQPDHSERFDYYSQILCKEGLTGPHCYWEVEWSSGARIGVTYLTINRKGKNDDCCLGHNEKSWSLSYSDSCFYACHNNKETEISAPYSSRIGVYVDYPSGTISFYGVSESMRLLHMFKTSITATLYPAFYLLYSESSVKISQLD
ncbi:tripartite motif-containing protein 16-like protein [Polypterus senegalus]|uniref:tripartite motif-containing protein 16-like protein n=1 Tax=Polypterus senegalus TaxID=55291 RepID=UPI001963E7F2|nr:tripartite motif-containing protein 16-like protein [Polypterus senegalus]